MIQKIHCTLNVTRIYEIQKLLIVMSSRNIRNIINVILKRSLTCTHTYHHTARSFKRKARTQCIVYTLVEVCMGQGLGLAQPEGRAWVS
jgi:hypothetical protein